MTVQPVETPATVRPTRESLGEYIARRAQAIRSGDFGSLPVGLGLLLIVIIFQVKNSNFVTPGNFVNLLVQMAGVTTIAYGVVFVLLLGEIDLSAGYVSGVAGAAVALLLLQDGSWQLPSGWLALPVALSIGAGIGLLHGLVITRFGVPSFVVTLAGLLIWNGVVLRLMGGQGNVSIQDHVIVGIANNFVKGGTAYLIIGLLVAAFAAFQFQRYVSLRGAGLAGDLPAVIVAQIVLLALVGVLVAWYASRDRGVPYVTLLLVGLLVFWTYVATRTRFGRHVYAVGGNAEAARRAGINVNRIRVAVFMISGMMAALGGVILASRLRSVDTAAGSGALLLNVIAAAVIGGTSLFGGRGNVSSALLGALVISSVANGMALLSLASGNEFIVTGLILLGAATVDAVSRRRLATAGR